MKLMKHLHEYNRYFKRNTKELMKVEKIGDKLTFLGENATLRHNFIKENCKGDIMPFSFEDGMPAIRGTRLDTHFKVSLKRVKRLSGGLKKDCCISFVIKDGELTILCWYPSGDPVIIPIPSNEYEIFQGDDLIVTFDIKFKKILQGFTKEIQMNAKDKKHPVWIWETSKDWALGVFTLPIDIDDRLEDAARWHTSPIIGLLPP